MPKITPELTGLKFGKLLVLEKTVRKHQAYWACLCDCGMITSTRGVHLTTGKTKSCGCLRMTHGHYSNAPGAYNSWKNMMQRCLDKDNRQYKNYGGRGITPSDEWLVFDNFFKDMGERPAGLTLERINNNDGYSKQNCKWADRTEQNNNKRNSIRIIVNGNEMSLLTFSMNSGINYKVLWSRIFRDGMTPEESIAIPAQKRRCEKGKK